MSSKKILLALACALLPGCSTGGINLSGLLQNDRVAEQTMDALALAAQGDRHRDDGDYRAAHDAYRSALQLEPRNPYIHVAVATTYVRQAAKAYEASKASFPFKPFGDPNAKREANAFFNRATAACREALAINPNHGAALLAIAEAHGVLEEWNAAEERLDEIETRNLIPARQQAAFYSWRGYVRVQLGRRERANEDFDKATTFARPFPYSEYAEYARNPPSPFEQWFFGVRPPSLPAVVTEAPPASPRQRTATPPPAVAVSATTTTVSAAPPPDGSWSSSKGGVASWSSSSGGVAESQK